jgi:hypothetical protein
MSWCCFVGVAVVAIAALVRATEPSVIVRVVVVAPLVAEHPTGEPM